MEEGLRSFYQALADHVRDDETRQLFQRLSGFEELHQEKLFSLYRSLTKESPTREKFEGGLDGEFAEGGVSVRELLERYADRIETTVGALDLALSIEAQALDLYLRFADKAVSDEIRRVVFGIADEEKIHLRHLGKMLGRKV